MTIKEAILKVLEDNVGSFTYLEVLNLINVQNYVDWSNAKTPSDTIGAQLGQFIRENDSRVKRVKGNKGFQYYLAIYENDLNLSEVIEKEEAATQKKQKNNYHERDLHLLLSSYLKNNKTFSKTILHEKSANSRDEHQKWIHPDMIGVKFLELKNEKSNSLLKMINKAEVFDLYSYEIKKEIKSDYELKKCFFQAVSNSSWANYGYLVAFDIGDNLKNEIERLNQSFGIGVIRLNANPYRSEILFHAKYKELDFTTIDKLCEVNSDFESFIGKLEKVLNAPEKYARLTRDEFENFCDDYLKQSEIAVYCKEKNIPNEEENI